MNNEICYQHCDSEFYLLGSLGLVYVCLQFVDIYGFVAEGTLGDVLDAEVIVQLKLRFLYSFTTKEDRIIFVARTQFC